MTASSSTLRVGVYIDAFNLYYGGRARFGAHSPGWRWLDLAKLSQGLLNKSSFRGGTLTVINYCTAERGRDGDPSSLERQRTYIRQLLSDDRVHVEYGSYIVVEKSGLLTFTAGKRNKRSAVVPKQILLDQSESELLFREHETGLVANIRTFEEKGSDVNIATLLMRDVFTRTVDAAIVISNDADLRLPLEIVREFVPTGLVNPGQRQLAHHLAGKPDSGVGGHWWYRLENSDFLEGQFTTTISAENRPPAW